MENSYQLATNILAINVNYVNICIQIFQTEIIYISLSYCLHVVICKPPKMPYFTLSMNQIEYSGGSKFKCSRKWRYPFMNQIDLFISMYWKLRHYIYHLYRKYNGHSLNLRVSNSWNAFYLLRMLGRGHLFQK